MRALAVRDEQPLLSVLRVEHHVPLRLEVDPEPERDAGIVLHDEHGSRRALGGAEAWLRHGRGSSRNAPGFAGVGFACALACAAGMTIVNVEPSPVTESTLTLAR